MTSVDFAKVFDIVAWNFLLPFLDFGDNLICLIQIVLKNIQSKIKINGLQFDASLIIQRVLQDYPLFMFLYIIAIMVFINFSDNDMDLMMHKQETKK